MSMVHLTPVARPSPQPESVAGSVGVCTVTVKIEPCASAPDDADVMSAFELETSPVGSLTETDGVAAKARALGTTQTSRHATAATKDRIGFTTPPPSSAPEMDESHPSH